MQKHNQAMVYKYYYVNSVGGGRHSRHWESEWVWFNVVPDGANSNKHHLLPSESQGAYCEP